MPVLLLLFRDKDLTFDPKSESSFSEAKKLYFRQEVLGCLAWKLRGESDKIIQNGQACLNYAYKQGREYLASNFWIAATQCRFLPSLEMPHGSANYFFQQLTQSKVHFHVQLDPTASSAIRFALQQVRKWKQEVASSAQLFVGGTNYSNGSKTGTCM